MYIVKAKHIHTGFPGSTMTDGFIVVESGKIKAVEQASELDRWLHEENQEVNVIDLGDVTLMPGLIDVHVHLGFSGGTDPVGRMQSRSNEQLLVEMVSNARLLLKSGVTTARELGARDFLDVAVKEGIEEGLIDGPNLVISNRPITPKGGHCWYMGCECENEEDIRNAVHQHAEAGADLIKIMATGGAITKGTFPWEASFNLQEMKATTEESHGLGLKVAAHAHGVEGIRNSVDANVDTIEHCSWFTKDGIEYNEELVTDIIDKGIYICPTTNISWKIDTKRIEDRIPQLKRMYERGVKFIMGTDAGIPHVTHDKYVDGLEVLALTGMTNAQLLEASTSIAAEALGVQDKTGSIEAGKDADMIAVRGNPLDDISTLRNIEFVMRKGNIPDFVSRS
ncbi:imidazolonepropionase-like amidohydrolase [Sporosarcina luteola]|nr:imidazolonepropionase-like amidohydrolase [Sporosarcina luteola]